VSPFKSSGGSDDRIGMRIRGILALALLASVAAPAGAEMYRCEGPDGTITFTGNAAACPGATPHAPSRDLQRLDSEDAADEPLAPEGDGTAPPADAPAAPAKRRDPAEGDDAQAAMWKRKRIDAENESRAIEHDLTEFDEMVTWCNRGGGLVLEDRVGVRKDYSCAEARDQHERLGARAAELKRYLAGGLEEECRRAGCLPGWLR
jgi:hypothetical protein